MIFSRIHTNLKRQDWFTVSLEFAAVVFGVFLALQAENWNEWRKDRIEEERFLHRLHDALVDSNSNAKFIINYMKEHAGMAGVVLESLEACKIAEADRRLFANGIYQLGQAVPPNVPEGIFSELRDTGRATLIQNEEIRDAINDILTGYDYYMSFHNDVVAQIIPTVAYVNRQVIFEIDSDSGSNQFIEWEEMSLDLDAVCRDSQFKASVATARRFTYEVVRWNELALIRHQRLVDIIAAELDGSDSS